MSKVNYQDDRIKIYHTKITKDFTVKKMNLCLKKMNQKLLLSNNLGYYRIKDKKASVLGKLLLYKGLIDFKVEKSQFNTLRYCKSSKPYLKEVILILIFHIQVTMLYVL